MNPRLHPVSFFQFTMFVFFLYIYFFFFVFLLYICFCFFAFVFLPIFLFICLFYCLYLFLFFDCLFPSVFLLFSLFVCLLPSVFLFFLFFFVCQLPSVFLFFSLFLCSLASFFLSLSSEEKHQFILSREKIFKRENTFLKLFFSTLNLHFLVIDENAASSTLFLSIPGEDINKTSYDHLTTILCFLSLNVITAQIYNHLKLKKDRNNGTTRFEIWEQWNSASRCYTKNQLIEGSSEKVHRAIFFKKNNIIIQIVCGFNPFQYSKTHFCSSKQTFFAVSCLHSHDKLCYIFSGALYNQ